MLSSSSTLHTCLSDDSIIATTARCVVVVFSPSSGPVALKRPCCSLLGGYPQSRSTATAQPSTQSQFLFCLPCSKVDLSVSPWDGLCMMSETPLVSSFSHLDL